MVHSFLCVDMMYTHN